MRMTNSSPPLQATTFDWRHFCSSSRPTRASTRSPSRWPSESLTSLNLSKSMSTTENGRPERDARFHSELSASQKKRLVLMPVNPSVIDCCCSFWKTKELCKAVARRSASVFRISHEHTFDEDTGDAERLQSTLMRLSEMVRRRLRESPALTIIELLRKMLAILA